MIKYLPMVRFKISRIQKEGYAIPEYKQEWSI